MKQRTMPLGVALLSLGGILLRLIALQNDFWMDEIWSWEFAHIITSPFQILTGIHHDNNHYLNTLFLYLLRDQSNWILYRLPSFAFGIATLFLGWWIGKKNGEIEGLVTLLLFSTSFLLILYSSEARGYAPAVFFALCAYTMRHRSLPLLWISCVLGLLSHLSFGVVIFALLAEDFSSFWNGKQSVKNLILRQSIPLLATLALFLTDILWMEIGGKDSVFDTLQEVRETWTLPFGLPGTLAAFIIALMIVGVIFSTLWPRVRREESHMFLGTLFLVPAIIMVIVPFGPTLWFPRYALIPLVFFLLLLSRTLCEWWRMGWKIPAATLLFLILIGNALFTVELFRFGRGSYRAALEEMKNQTESSEITVGSNQPVGVIPTLRFYERFMGATFVYHDPSDGSPLWFIVTSQPPQRKVSPVINVFETDYTLLKTYPTAQESGFTWSLYTTASPSGL